MPPAQMPQRKMGAKCFPGMNGGHPSGGVPMKITCVIFDLFGTLVDNISVARHRETLDRVARVLSVPENSFYEGWNATYRERATGSLATTRDALVHICARFGVTPDDTPLREACRIRTEFTRDILAPRHDAIATLSTLGGMGLRIGLISDCSSEVPPLWDASPLAPHVHAAVFSCLARVKKPDPAIYHLACSRLRVEPGRVLYVGDGSSHELDGALAVGMFPVRIDPPRDPGFEAFRIEEQGWDGTVIHELGEIPGLVREWCGDGRDRIRER